MKRKSKSSIFLLFLFFAASIFFGACPSMMVDMGPEDGYWAYQFVNETKYSVVITLRQLKSEVRI
jgi:hypothetical protein